MSNRQERLDREWDTPGPPSPPENRYDYWDSFLPLLITVGGVVFILLIVLGILLFGRCFGV